MGSEKGEAVAEQFHGLYSCCRGELGREKETRSWLMRIRAHEFESEITVSGFESLLYETSSLTTGLRRTRTFPYGLGKS